MGYHTTFSGEIKIDPPLNPSEIAYLKDFAETRRMDREAGPYFVNMDGQHGQSHGPDTIFNYNDAPPGQPGLWCQWVPNEDGTALVWDQGEKFYNADEWMTYLIDHFLKAGCVVERKAIELDWSDAEQKFDVPDRFDAFTSDHLLNGVIHAQGEEHGDVWSLVVRNNVVERVDGHIASDLPSPHNDYTFDPTREQKIEDALRKLVALKDGPRDERYRNEKDAAWQAAREALR